MSRSHLSGLFMSAVIVPGAICTGLAAYYTAYSSLDINFLVIAACTLIFGPRLMVRIPSLRSHISVSDLLIFLTLFIYGGGPAVLLAAAEAFLAARRFCNKLSTVAFNASTMALSTGAVAALLSVVGATFGGGTGNVGGFRELLVTFSLVAVTQFATNTVIAAAYDSLASSVPFAETWKNKYLWTYFTYLVGAAGAGALVQTVSYAGFVVVFAALPIILLSFLAYRKYLSIVDHSVEQAEEAKRYASVLEERTAALRESEQRFRSAFTYAPIGIALVSPTGQWLKVNKALTEMLGYSADEFLETDFQNMISAEDYGNTVVEIHNLLAGKVANAQIEQRYLHKHGHTVWVLWSGSVASDSRSEKPMLIFQLHDITDKKLVEQKLQHDATHDALTGLPNRAYFMERLSHALEKFRQNPKYQVSVLFIDLDRFKYVNDSLGHMVGDRLLKSIAERLTECMRPPDIVARFGGDEFVVLVEGRYYNETVTRIAERIQRKFSFPFQFGENEIYSSASIGILHASEAHRTPEEMMRDADTAMYQAKRSGKARHEVFDENMHRTAKETLKLETELRRAIEKEEFEIVYQPIFSVSTGLLSGVEALTRWNHPEFGHVPPARFIPLAEEIGLIDQLGEFVLRRACIDMISIDGLFEQVPGFHVGVNLSCRQFVQAGMVRNIKSILSETGFPARALCLEITESVVFEHRQREIEMLQELRRLGIDLAIDDFGTGYSNLSYLVQLPISILKVDRAFIAAVGENGQNSEMVKAVVTIAHSLGLKVVAEGVETEAQLKVLRQLKCESVQGYLLARPMPVDDLASLIVGPVSSGLLREVPNDLLVEAVQ